MSRAAYVFFLPSVSRCLTNEPADSRSTRFENQIYRGANDYTGDEYTCCWSLLHRPVNHCNPTRLETVKWIIISRETRKETRSECTRKLENLSKQCVCGAKVIPTYMCMTSKIRTRIGKIKVRLMVALQVYHRVTRATKSKMKYIEWIVVINSTNK